MTSRYVANPHTLLRPLVRHLAGGLGFCISRCFTAGWEEEMRFSCWLGVQITLARRNSRGGGTAKREGTVVEEGTAGGGGTAVGEGTARGEGTAVEQEREEQLDKKEQQEEEEQLL